MTLATTIYADSTDPLGQSDSSDAAPKSAAAPLSATGGPSKNERFAGAGVGYTMVAAALLGVGIGYLIDAVSGTRPLWTILCFFLFLLAGTWQLIKETRK